MSFLQSLLYFGGAIILIFGAIEFWRTPDILTVLEKLFSPKYVTAFLALMAFFIFARLVLPLFFKLLFF